MVRARAGMAAGLFLAMSALLAAAPASAQSGEPMTVEADDLLEWNQTEGVYTATGNAVAIQGARTIRGDVLVATYDPESETQDIKTQRAMSRSRTRRATPAAAS